MEGISVVGLGRMGRPIATRLAQHADVVGFDVDSTVARDVGVRVAESLEAVLSTCPATVLVLPGAAAEERALLPDAIAAVPPGALLLELTSGDPRLSVSLAARADAGGFDYVAAPMGGGPDDAAAGTLTFFVGGKTEGVERSIPILRLLGDARKRHLIGDDPAQAQAVKLLANAVWFGQAALVAEAVVAGAALGIDPLNLQQAFAGSAAASVFVERDLPRALRGDYLESFALAGVVEELDATVAIAQTSGTSDAVLSTVAELHRETHERFGDVDGELLVFALLAERAGLTLGMPHPHRVR